jgi:hypothetical protein
MHVVTTARAGSKRIFQKNIAQHFLQLFYFTDKVTQWWVAFVD